MIHALIILGIVLVSLLIGGVITVFVIAYRFGGAVQRDLTWSTDRRRRRG